MAMIRLKIVPLLVTLVLPLLSNRAEAVLIMSISNVTGPVAGVGTFEVLLSNTAAPGGASFDVAGFSFELAVSPASGVQFTAADTATLTAAYLFDGVGGAPSIPPSRSRSTPSPTPASPAPTSPSWFQASCSTRAMSLAWA